MRITSPRAHARMLFWILALSLAGCRSAQQPPPANDKAAAEAASAANEARGVAEASLGKDAEILAHGDLALTGREQLLVVNRFSEGAQASKRDANAALIFVTRAAVLEKNDGKWSQILLCDEHLKNTSGYLGGSTEARATGWRLEFSQNAKDGLEMSFAPAQRNNADYVNVGQSFGPPLPIFHVRWNKSARRYQSFDASHERYLSERPSLVLPESVLK